MARWNADAIPSLKGKRAIVTGANGGLGYFTALELARHGAQVTIACRSSARAEAAADKIRAAAPEARLEVMLVDVGDLDSIRVFAAKFKARHRRLDILCNNAGVVAQPLARTRQGFEFQMGTNYFGPFVLTGLLLDLIRATPAARVVNVASVAHKFGRLPMDDLNWEKRRYNEWRGYGQSKLALLLFTYELQRRLQKVGIDAISVAAHPGYAATNLVSSEMKLASHWLGKAAMDLGNRLLAQPAEMGALATLMAATSADIKGGDYIGPGGIGEMRGYPKKVRSTRASHNLESASQLWTASEQLTGLSYLSA
jgi:NAD(P)-dependent dehydrogenase (short-subunit alcohol dehydrogenase family)